MIVLGLGFTDHEASAALVVDGTLSTAIARERLSRKKRDGKMWGTGRLDLTSAINYCFDEHNLSLDDVDLLVWSHIDHASKDEVLGRLEAEGGIDLSNVASIAIPHHFAHACSAFYTSPFEESAVMVVDGSGGPLGDLVRNCSGPDVEHIAHGEVLLQNLRSEYPQAAREHESFYVANVDGWRPLRKIFGQWGGVGAEYGAVSERLFGDCLEGGKTMGLAPYGEPDESALFFERVTSIGPVAFKSSHSSYRDELEERIDSLKSEARYREYSLSEQVNYAASMQREAEDALLEFARWLRTASGSTRLCLAGGVALNCVANSLIAREAGFTEVFIPPAPADDGIALGCALYGSALTGGRATIESPVFLGRSYASDEQMFIDAGMTLVAKGQEVPSVIAQAIATGSVVAWYQGGAEIGPRALGHRSILADPRRPGMRDYLNRTVKNRESFRPFAPVVLHENVLEYFAEAYPSYFMSFIAELREEHYNTLPAVRHIDGTARYQVLRRKDNPELYAVVEAFAEITGVPVLVNTSFNRAGEPLVETPYEAVACAISCSVDYLVVDGRAYSMNRGASKCL